MQILFHDLGKVVGHKKAEHFIQTLLVSQTPSDFQKAIHLISGWADFAFANNNHLVSVTPRPAKYVDLTISDVAAPKPFLNGDPIPL